MNTAPPLEWAGAVVAALAAAGALALPGRRARGAAMLVALVAAPATLALGFSGDLPSGAPTLAAGALLGLVVVVGIAVLVHRRPGALLLLSVAALPFRLPLEVGGQSAKLLLPMYAVVGGGCLAYVWSALGPDGRDERVPRGRAVRALELALAASIALYAIQAAYTTDFDTALKNLTFFHIPFALLLRALLEVPVGRRLLLACLGVAVGLALAFALIGIYEHATKSVLLNPKVVTANRFEPYFRVSSLFFDPNVYGRFLALAMVALAGVLAWTRRPRAAWLAVAALVVLWVGLLFSYSQSSFTALLVGVAALAALRWGPRLVAGVAGAAAVAGVIALLAFPGALGVNLGSEESIDSRTSGRLELALGGAQMFADRPLIGFGSGSFAERFRAREESPAAVGDRAASHTIPLTVAAEQGIVGLAAYAAVLVTAFMFLFAGLWRRELRGPSPPFTLAARAVLAAAFAALFVHTLLYAAFLEDPVAWVLLGMATGVGAGGASGARAGPGEPARTASSSR